jgi:hypothetical protein
VNLPLEGPVIVVRPLMFFESFLAIEELLTVLNGAFKKHFIRIYLLSVD